MKNLNTTSRSLGKSFESRSSVQDCSLRIRGSFEVLVFAPVVGIQEVTMKKHTNATPSKIKKTNPKWLRDLKTSTSFIGGAK